MRDKDEGNMESDEMSAPEPSSEDESEDESEDDSSYYTNVERFCHWQYEEVSSFPLLVLAHTFVLPILRSSILRYIA
jgi:hypothetical protein